MLDTRCPVHLNTSRVHGLNSDYHPHGNRGKENSQGENCPAQLVRQPQQDVPGDLLEQLREVGPVASS
jgi:hypothetical protein